MQYPELATVQARLTSFLVENLAAGSTVEWMDAFHAQLHAAEALGIADRELPWLGTRVDPRGYKSFGKRLSRKIVCGDCGRPFGHKNWHSGTPTGATCGSARRTTSSVASAPSTRRCCW